MVPWTCQTSQFLLGSPCWMCNRGWVGLPDSGSPLFSSSHLWLRSPSKTLPQPHCWIQPRDTCPGIVRKVPPQLPEPHKPYSHIFAGIPRPAMPSSWPSSASHPSSWQAVPAYEFPAGCICTTWDMTSARRPCGCLFCARHLPRPPVWLSAGWGQSLETGLFLLPWDLLSQLPLLQVWYSYSWTSGGSAGSFHVGSRGNKLVPHPPIIMYPCPNADFISHMLLSGSNESSTCLGSHWVLSKPAAPLGLLPRSCVE